MIGDIDREKENLEWRSMKKFKLVTEKEKRPRSGKGTSTTREMRTNKNNTQYNPDVAKYFKLGT